MNTNERAKCKTCRTMTRVPEGYVIAWQEVWPVIVPAGTVKTYDRSNWLRCSCGKTLLGEIIVAKTGKQECGAKCTSAIGPACECKCKGEMHGIGAAA